MRRVSSGSPSPIPAGWAKIGTVPMKPVKAETKAQRADRAARERLEHADMGLMRGIPQPNRDADFHAWLLGQVEALRNGRFNSLDWDDLAGLCLSSGGKWSGPISAS